MLIVMHKKATQEQVDKVCKKVKEMRLTPHPIPGAQRIAIGITGNKSRINPESLINMQGVRDIIHVTKPYKLTNREMKEDDTIIKIRNAIVGGEKIAIFAGPCSVESYEQTYKVAECVSRYGNTVLRGGAFKPRTSPYSFQGLGEKGLKILSDVGKKTNLPVVSEAMDVEKFDMVEKYVDIVQIGARNMQNYSLLKRAGKSNKPIFLKRGLSATLTEFLLAAEYIMSEGNYNIILCERGIRTFSNHTRFTLDISSIPKINEISHLPLIVDPSHATGERTLVAPVSKASVAAGADGIMVEVHPEPEKALSDGPQSLTIEMFENLMSDIKIISQATQKTFNNGTKNGNYK